MALLCRQRPGRLSALCRRRPPPRQPRPRAGWTFHRTCNSNSALQGFDVSVTAVLLCKVSGTLFVVCSCTPLCARPGITVRNSLECARSFAGSLLNACERHA